MNEDSTHYATLGVARDASAEQIKAAYRALAKELHPDHHPGDTSKEQRFKVVTAAYEIVSDPEKRRAYDEQLALDEAAAAERRRVEEDVARQAAEAARMAEEFERVRQRVSVISPAAPLRGSGGDFPWGELLGGIAKVGIAALIINALSGGRSRPVQPRGADGRFRRDPRSDRGPSTKRRRG